MTANGRTSTFRLQAFDPSAASLSTTPRSAASKIQRPPRSSFDSTKAPSVNSAPPPRLSITVAVPGAARPPAKTQWPSAASRSLNASIAATSSGRAFAPDARDLARSAVSSITETRYCISDHLLCFGAPLAGGRSPLLRTALPRSDTASRTSFKDFLVRLLRLGERRGSRSGGQRAASGPAGAWRADDPWDDIWENQGNANPLTVGTFLSAVSHALDASPSLAELPFVQAAARVVAAFQAGHEGSIPFARSNTNPKSALSRGYQPF